MTTATSTPTTELRCTNCGCGLSAGVAECPACGHASLGSSVSPGATGDYRLAPMPAGKYDVELGVTETLSATFKLWTENLKSLAVLGFVPYALLIPVAVFGALFIVVGAGPGLGFFEGMEPFAIAVGTGAAVLFTVLSLAAAGGVVHLVDEKLHGVTVKPMTALVAGLRHAGWLFLLYVVVSVVSIVGFAGPVAPIAVAITQDNPMVALLALPGLLTTAAAIFVNARIAPAFAAVVVEDIGLGQALSRAWSLTRGHTTTVIGASVLFMLAYLGLSMMVGFMGIVPIIGALAQLAANAVLLPLLYLFPFALYAGLVRAEQQLPSE